MTVSTTDVRSGPYTPNAVTKTFPFTFKVITGDEVRIVRGASYATAALVSPSLYAVTVLPAGGGTVTFTTAPIEVDGSIWIESEPNFTQEISFENQGAFLPEVLTEALDRAAMRVLYLRDRLTAQTVTYLDQVYQYLLDAQTAASGANSSKLLADADAVATSIDRTQTGIDKAAVTGMAASIAGTYSNIQAMLLAGSLKTFASTADALSNGVRGLTASGAGLANGQYTLTGSGGAGTGFSGRALVAGGTIAVGAAIVLQPGINYTSAPTISGVTSATITAIIGANTVDGDYFAVPNGTSGKLDIYKNVAAAAVFQFTFESNTRAKEIAADVYAAVPVSKRSGISLLITKDGAKTYKTGTSVGEIETMLPLIAPSGTKLAQAGTTWNGTGGAAPARPLRPVEDATGIVFHREVNFQIQDSGGVEFSPLTDTTVDSWTIEVWLRLPAVAATFASVAAMNAAVATYKVGDIVKVTGGAVITPPGGYFDIPWADIGMVDINGSIFLQGYYIRGNVAFSAFSTLPITGFWDSSTEPAIASKFGFLYVDNVGRFRWYSYDGSNQTQLYSYGDIDEVDYIAAANGRPIHVKVEKRASDVVMYIDGVERDAWHVVPTVTPNRMHVNGVGPNTNATTPVGAFSWTMDAMLVTQGLDYTENRLVSDAVSSHMGTPLQLWNEVAYLHVIEDQSRFAGSADASSTGGNPDPYSNWGFSVAGRVVNDLRLGWPSGDHIPGCYACEGIATQPGRIGPLKVFTYVYGAGATGSGTHTMSGSGAETIEWGYFRELLKYDGAKGHHHYMVGATFGGYSERQIVAEDAGQYLYELLDPSATVTQPRTQLLRAIMYMVKRCKARRQRLRLLFHGNFQGETLSYTLPDQPVQGALHKTDHDALMAYLDKVLDNSGEVPVYAKKAITYGYPDNFYNQPAAYYQDDQFLKLEDARSLTFRPIFFGSTYALCGRGIHWPHMLTRDYGMQIGHHVGKAYFDHQKAAAIRVVSTQISGSNLLLNLNRAVTIIQTNGPMVTGYMRTDGVAGTGFKTYGLVFTPVSGGRVINGDVTLAGGGLQIVVPISGGGPIAGDKVDVTGTATLFTNFRETTVRNGYYNTQTWAARPFVSQPVLDLSSPSIISDWLSPQHIVV